MKIEALLRRKGDFVATVAPDAAIGDAVRLLAEHNVGALVVSSDGRRAEGMLSERDVVRSLATTGGPVLGLDVRSVMSSTLHCCAPDDDVDSLNMTMTNHRIRHVPVLRDGELVGIVSIGDVVKTRMEELEKDRRALVDYINAR